MKDIANFTPTDGLVSRHRSIAFVPFLFGVAGVPELPGTVLNRLLTDLGLSISAARALIARLRGAGQLASVRRGRAADYRLAGDLARGFHRVRAGAGRPPANWEGRFHALLYQVPERHRAYRDLLRRTALLAGYGMAQQGLLIALTDLRGRVGEVLAQCPAGARVSAVDLLMSTEDAARVVFEAWHLAELHRRYRTHIRTLRASVRSTAKPQSGARTLRRFAELSITPLVDTLRDPGLPAELLPPEWLWAELFEVIGAVHAHYGPPAAEYVHGLLPPRP